MEWSRLAAMMLGSKKLIPWGRAAVPNNPKSEKNLARLRLPYYV